MSSLALIEETLRRAKKEKSWALVKDAIALCDLGPSEYAIPIRGGMVYVVPQSKVDEWSATFGEKFVSEVLPVIVQWNRDNPANRKTAVGMNRHICAWLMRERERRRSEHRDCDVKRVTDEYMGRK